MSEIYISVDVETSGPIPGSYSMLAIGACEVGRTDNTFYAELHPINESFVPEAMKVVGRSLDDFASSGREPADVMQAFSDWLTQVSDKQDVVFVGFNATFDWSFINWYFHTYLGNNPFGFGGVDIKSYYMGLVGSTWAETRSSRIPSKFKGASPHTHNAVDDAIEQAEMFERMRTASMERSK